MDIREDDVQGSEILSLLEEHHADMARHSPPESVHTLDIQELRVPQVTVWTAWDSGTLLGCGALKELGPHEGEIKSMRSVEAQRGRGVGARILEHMIREARRRGLPAPQSRNRLHGGARTRTQALCALRLRVLSALRRLPPRSLQCLHDEDPLRGGCSRARPPSGACPRRPQIGWRLGREGSGLVPRNETSTARAASRPSQIAHTTSDAPRVASPQAKTPGRLVS